MIQYPEIEIAVQNTIVNNKNVLASLRFTITDFQEIAPFTVPKICLTNRWNNQIIRSSSGM